MSAMTDMFCTYGDAREAAVIDYVYGELGRDEYAAFTAHLSGCAPCRRDVDDLRGVRSTLEKWAPPEPQFSTPRAAALPPGRPDGSSVSWWRDLPVWAQFAAAMLVLGVSAGIANLDVRFADGGLSLHTGWLKSAPPPATATPAPSISQADLMALEQRLRKEFDAASLQAAAVKGEQPDPETLVRRMKALIQQSEERQNREIALRVGQLAREVDLARQEDLGRIDNSLAQIRSRTTRTQQTVDYMQKVSLQR